MVAEKSLKGNSMQYLCKLTILIALLVSQILGQQVGPPEFTSQDSTNMLTWKIPNIKSAEVTGYSIDPAKIEISVKTKEKLDHVRFNEYFNTNSLYRASYLPKSKKESLITLFFRKYPEYVIQSSDSTVSFSFKKEVEKIADLKTKEESIIPDTTINLVFNGASLSEVLKALSFKYGMNILNNSTSIAPITVNANGVNLKTIFNSILETNGLTWYSTENIIIITDAENIMGSKSGLETVVVHLNYIESEVAITSFSDQLSPRGTMIPLDITGGKGAGGTNKLIITDTKENIDIINNLINKIDIRPKQINISVKFIETSLQTDERLGIDWTQRAQLSGPEMPPDSGTGAIGIGSWQEFAMAKMDLPLYQVIIEALESDNQTKLLQEPQVTTFDNFKANVNIGTTLPVLVPQGEGSVFGTNPYTFENVNVDIQLDVTPRVNSSDEISLQLDTQVSAIINFVGPDKDRPVVSTRSAKTNVMVGNGETLLIGGLILEDNTDNLGKVPFLSNIPIIKNFFTMKTKGRQQRELLIFITPAIIG